MNQQDFIQLLVVVTMLFVLLISPLQSDGAVNYAGRALRAAGVIWLIVFPIGHMLIKYW